YILAVDGLQEERHMFNDIRLALRTLPRTAGYSLAFILTLGLGIGANTAIFSVINGVLLRPLPYPGADRVMHLRQAQLAAGVDDTSFSFAEVADYRREARTVDQFVEFGDWTFNVLGRGDAHRATGGLVTATFFQMLGARPRLGRTLIPSDEARTAPPVVVLTDAYWRRAFGAAPAGTGHGRGPAGEKGHKSGAAPPSAPIRRSSDRCST